MLAPSTIVILLAMAWMICFIIAIICLAMIQENPDDLSYTKVTLMISQNFVIYIGVAITIIGLVEYYSL